jgi:hypothetical protein
MTDADEWLTCQEPQKMLELLLERGKLTERKARLFAVACCRSVWPLLTAEVSRTAVEVAERFADGQATSEELEAAGDAAGDAPWAAGDSYGECVAHAAIWATGRDAPTAAEVASRFARGCDQEARRPDGSWIATRPDEERRQADLRDIFGPWPFGAKTTIPATVLAWNDGCIPKLAASIYEEGDFSQERMGVLADALEEAGLTDEEILLHCRGLPAVHCRGCWLVDLVLGKE